MPDRVLDAELDAFRTGLAWVLERKDFNAFWPIGIPAAGTGGAPRLLESIEHLVVTRAASRQILVRNPTALMIVFLYAIYGMREAGWPVDRRLRFAEALFRVMRRSKRTPTIASHGAYCLTVPTPTAVPPEAWLDASPSSTNGEYAGIVHSLSGTIWAYAEALYFFNHRVCTERHGPYPAEADDRAMLVRSAYELTPASIWPEITSWPPLPSGVEIVGMYRGAHESSFDLFANPLFTFDVNEAVDRLAVGLRYGTTWQWRPSPSILSDLVVTLRELMSEVLRCVETLTMNALSERVYTIMLSACRQAFGDAPPVAVSPSPRRISAGRPVRGTVEQLLVYYDIREELEWHS